MKTRGSKRAGEARGKTLELFQDVRSTKMMLLKAAIVWMEYSIEN